MNWNAATMASRETTTGADGQPVIAGRCQAGLTGAAAQGHMAKVALDAVGELARAAVRNKDAGTLIREYGLEDSRKLLELAGMSKNASLEDEAERREREAAKASAHDQKIMDFWVYKSCG